MSTAVTNAAAKSKGNFKDAGKSRQDFRSKEKVLKIHFVKIVNFGLICFDLKKDLFSLDSRITTPQRSEGPL